MNVSVPRTLCRFSLSCGIGILRMSSTLAGSGKAPLSVYTLPMKNIVLV